jgi:hypothetical protein
LPGRISELKLRPDFIFSVLKNKILNKISTEISALFLHHSRLLLMQLSFKRRSRMPLLRFISVLYFFTLLFFPTSHFQLP